MRKVFTIFNFVLCAAMMLAQIPRNNTNSAKYETSYRGSIFTKSLISESFSGTNPTYTGGWITGSNTQTAQHSHWTRVADTTSSTLVADTIFPVLFNSRTGFSSLSDFESQTPMNGFMVMSMQDQISMWGGTGTIGHFGSWIAFEGFDPNGATKLEVSFYQYYRAFNRDSCFIDYSTDSTNWNSVYFNTRVEISSNNSTFGQKMVTIPVPTGANEMYVRIRWKSDTNTSGGYGYFWIIDDVEINTPPRNRIEVLRELYSEGNYQLVPKGMQMPELDWYAYVKNTGTDTQYNTQGEIRTVGTPTNVLGTSQSMNLLPDSIPDYLIIGLNAGGGQSSGLPSSNLGTQKIYSTVFSDSLNDNNGKSIILDTIAYVVNENTSDSSYVWGHDNGTLVGFSDGCWLFGDWAFYEDNVNFNRMLVAYTTSSTVPTDWVIRGIELVAAPGMEEYYATTAGSKIEPLLWWDSSYISGGLDYIGFKTSTTGSSIYTIQQSDLNTFDTGYYTFGNYNTIRIEFPMQPDLIPDRTYRIGYRSVSGDFVPATFRGTYLDSNGVCQQLPNNLNTSFGLSNTQTLIIKTSDESAWCGSCGIPYIRMLVGPKKNTPSYNLTFDVNVNDGGTVYKDDFDETVITGHTQTVFDGTYYSIVFCPDTTNGYSFYGIDVNGQPEDMNTWFDGFEAQGHRYILRTPAIHQNTRIKFHCTPLNLDTSDEATIKLQPNPASSIARLTIDGVNGDVNYALIDVNGRVIDEKVIDANNVETIDLNYLARGTYFVRITNNEITKVEKLIVQ